MDEQQAIKIMHVLGLAKGKQSSEVPTNFKAVRGISNQICSQSLQ